MTANAANSGFVGRVLGGRWVVGEQLGSGSFGVVHAGVERGTGLAVAVKLLHPQFLHHHETIARFWNEAEALRRMNHPNVLVLLDVGVAEDGVPYLVTELLTGETLRDLLNREKVLSADRAMRLLGPAAHALHHAHLAGIVHRDLKPENIFRVRRDGMGTTKILDFGVAKLLDTTPGKKLSQTGIMVGTMAYSPPEQMQGVGDIDHRADQFGFAALMFESLTGRRPFPQEQPFALFQAVMSGPRPKATDFNGALPKAVDDVLVRGLAADRVQRFENVEAFYLALTQSLTGQPIAAAPPAAPIPAAPRPPSDSHLSEPSAVYRPVAEDATRVSHPSGPPGGGSTMMTGAASPRPHTTTLVEGSSAPVPAAAPPSLGSTLVQGSSATGIDGSSMKLPKRSPPSPSPSEPPISHVEAKPASSTPLIETKPASEALSSKKDSQPPATFEPIPSIARPSARSRPQSAASKPQRNLVPYVLIAILIVAAIVFAILLRSSR